jgi:hypothetical protein
LRENFNGQITLTPFDAADIGAVKTNVVREVFLRPAKGFTFLPDSVPEYF